MKKLLTTLLFGSIFSACAERQPVPAIPSDPEIEGKIEKLLKGMTLEEKIGQMCELTIGVVTDKNNNKLSEALLDTVIGKYKVGSLLNIPFGVSQKKEVFAEVITQIQKKSLEEIGIPCIYGLDQIHGASYTQDATYFPQGINMAATFNRELARRCAEITAYETRACCVPWTFAPVMDLGRDPRWMNIIFHPVSSILWDMGFQSPVKTVLLLLLPILTCVRNTLLLSRRRFVRVPCR